MKIDRPMWGAGALLSPQQFQQQGRWEAWTNECLARMSQVHPWGIQIASFDLDALRLDKLKATRLRVRLTMLILYTDGGMGMTFQLQAKPVRNVVQTTFILDGVTLEYFNQMESWQQFTWPGGTDHPGASLSWTSVRAGARLFGDYSGTWGLIRLFEQAKVTALDDSNTRFELVLTAPDELPLTWQMRTELGNGPLALLELRGFTLPADIFDAGVGQADPYAAVEPFE